MVPPGVHVGAFAREVLSFHDSDTFKNVADILVSKLLDIIPVEIKCKNIEQMMTIFNSLAIQDTLFDLWHKFILEVKVNTNEQFSNMLFQFILTKLLQHLLAARNSILFEELTTPSEDDLKLTPSEENTLRYVAGYIPYSIKEGLKGRKDGETKEALTRVLSCWDKNNLSSERLEFLNYTREWTTKINRGGLFLVNDEFYIFIRRVENVARKILNKTLMISYAGEDLRKILMEKFSESHLVDISWNSLTKSLENRELCQTLKRMVLNKWVNIRANSFVKAWVNLAKLTHFETQKKKRISDCAKAKDKAERQAAKDLRQVKVDNKGTPSMRKTLQDSSL